MMNKYISVILKRNSLLCVSGVLLLFILASFCALGAGAKKTAQAGYAVYAAAVSDTAVLSQAQDALSAYNDSLRYLRNLPEKNSVKRSYPEIKAPNLKAFFDRLENKKNASALLAVLAAKYRPLEWDAINEKNINDAIKKDKEILKNIDDEKTDISGGAAMGPSGGMTGPYEAVFNFMLSAAVIAVLLLSGWALLYYLYSGRLINGFLTGSFEKDNKVKEAAFMLGFEKDRRRLFQTQIC